MAVEKRRRTRKPLDERDLLLQYQRTRRDRHNYAEYLKSIGSRPDPVMDDSAMYDKVFGVEAGAEKPSKPPKKAK